MAIKVLGNLAENYEVIEEEYRIFKDLSRHDNFPHFYGAFLNKFDKEVKDEIWLVMEVLSLCIFFSFLLVIFEDFQSIKTICFLYSIAKVDR